MKSVDSQYAAPTGGPPPGGGTPPTPGGGAPSPKGKGNGMPPIDDPGNPYNGLFDNKRWGGPGKGPPRKNGGPKFDEGGEVCRVWATVGGLAPVTDTHCFFQAAVSGVTDIIIVVFLPPFVFLLTVGPMDCTRAHYPSLALFRPFM